MKIYRSSKIRNNEINDSPVFYKSMGGNPYQTRLEGGIDVGRNMFKIEEIKTIDYQKLPDDTGPQIITYYHNLGFKPFVMGTYVVLSSSVIMGLPFPALLRGSIPEVRWPQYGAAIEHSTRVSLVDNNKVVIELNLDISSGIIRVKLNIMREPTVE